jgi:hypothetical protein
MRLLTLPLAAVLSVLPAICCEGTILHVPGDYEMICEATSVAVYGDTVLVSPGDHWYWSPECGPIRDGVVLTSEEGPASTKLFACNGGMDFSGLVVFDRGAGPSTEVSGFTIHCADIVEQGSVFLVINCQDASPQIRNNVIRAAAGYPEALIEADAISVWAGAHPTITNNTIIGPKNGIALSAGAAPSIALNIVAHTQAAGVYCRGAASPEISCNDFWDVPYPYLGCPPGEGDFLEDPLFCDPDRYDFSLRSDSPAVHGYGCGLVGALPVGCEPEAAEPTRWGFIKALYR